MREIFDYCIVGSGPSGLTCSYELLKDKKKILMIERDSRSGGLAKSYNYDGKFRCFFQIRYHYLGRPPLREEILEHNLLH